MGQRHYHYRYYSPALGRWLSRDPVGFADGYSLYTFAGNNSQKYIDMYGLQGMDPFLGLPAAIASDFYSDVQEIMDETVDAVNDFGDLLEHSSAVALAGVEYALEEGFLIAGEVSSAALDTGAEFHPAAESAALLVAAAATITGPIIEANLIALEEYLEFHLEELEKILDKRCGP